MIEFFSSSLLFCFVFGNKFPREQYQPANQQTNKQKITSRKPQIFIYIRWNKLFRLEYAIGVDRVLIPAQTN